MKFLIPTLALLSAGLAAAAELTSITCPLGQTQCGSGCVTGTCCDQETAKFCHPTETCTTVNGVIGCCPEGETCTSTEAPSCLNYTNARCSGENPESVCCNAEKPFCLSDTGKCSASLWDSEGSTSPATSTSTTQVSVTVRPTAVPTPAAVEEEEETGEEEEEEQEYDDEIELEEQEPVTRTEFVDTTSTISIPICGASSSAPCTTATQTSLIPVATVEPEVETECETFTRTKIIPVSTIYPTAIPTPSGKPTPNKNSTIVTQPSVSLPPQQQIGAASGLRVGGSLIAVVIAALAVAL